MHVTVRAPAFGRVSVPAGLPPPAAALVRSLRIALVAGIAYQLWRLLRPGPPGVVDQVMYDGALAVAAALCLTRARLVQAGRLAWACMGGAILAIAAGDVYRTLFPGDPPTGADVAFLLFYPLAYCSLVLLFRERARHFPRSAWLDGLIVGLGLTAATAAVAYGPLAFHPVGSPAAVVVGIAYPVGDLILLLIAGGLLALGGWRLEPTWVALAVGCVTIALADGAYLVQTAEGTYHRGDRIDPFWLISIAALAWASWLHPSRLRSVRLDPGWALLLPGVAVTSAVAVLVYGNVHRLPTAATVLAAGAALATLLRMLITFREIRSTARQRDEAMIDDLTGLGNRRLLLRRLADLLADGCDRRHALLLVDLDRFKDVNDSLGHPTGDELLRRLAPRLSDRAMPDETVVRLGGDEFAVVVPDIAGPEAAIAAADRIRTAFDAPITVDGVTLHLTASAGIALAPDHGREPTTLLSRADVAMYHAKRTTAGRTVYRPSDDRYTRERLQTAAELRRGLERGEIVCHYQPQLDLRSGRVDGVEALVRWAHPVRGLLPPDQFLPLAEQTGLMRQLTETVLRTALADCQLWESAGLLLAVSVNLAAESILDRSLIDQVRDLLAETPVPTRRLIVEITEGSLLGDPEQVKVVLERLRELGVSVSIDDYGVGYSSLSYLQRLPVDELKLDRQLVTPVARDKRAAAIVGSTVDLAHALGVRLVAEGVEDWRSLGRLVELGCDRAQGYYIARPMRPGDLPDWLRAWRYPQEQPSGPRREPGHLFDVAADYREASGG
jgi:diguanylate cyclase